MTKWDYIELRKLCKEKGIPDSTLYQNSLGWRWKRTDFHADKANEVWAELFMKSFTFVDQRCYEAIFSYEAHVESCVQSLHSMADILAQIINVIILGNEFPEHLVSIKKVLKSMEDKNAAPRVVESTRKLLADNVFNYIEAFCNTIKHRRLIKTDFRAEYGENARNESGLRFQEFTYKGSNFPQTWGSDILKKYRFHIHQLITEVGLNINRFVAES